MISTWTCSLATNISYNNVNYDVISSNFLTEVFLNIDSLPCILWMLLNIVIPLPISRDPTEEEDERNEKDGVRPKSVRDTTSIVFLSEVTFPVFLRSSTEGSKWTLTWDCQLSPMLGGAPTE